jgi:hypothetical protein
VQTCRHCSPACFPVEDEVPLKIWLYLSAACGMQVQPRDVGQARRIGGVNPADIDSLLIYLEVQRKQQHGVNRAPTLSSRQRREAQMALAANAALEF